MEDTISGRKIIGIIDYGAGNITSVMNALDYLSVDYQLIHSESDMQKYSKVILPGVGSFKHAMTKLAENKLDNAIRNFTETSSNKFLGICLGMQLLYDFSEEEGGCQGLGIIKGTVNRLVESDGFKIPNIGWREIIIKSPSRLYKDITSELIFYFVHSYACQTVDEKIITGTSDHNGLFSCSIEYENIFAVQFHPEKSQRVGLSFLENFVKI